MKNKRPINVLSLFDWMSCGRIALERAGMKVWDYFASEIDKFAIQVAKKNYPDIEHVGDVQKVSYRPSEILTWNIWTEDIKCIPTNIDILIWWSPCQWFSKAGKQLNFEDLRSKLFFEFVRILREVKPKYFLLENVRMKPEFERTITQYLDWVEPILINSSLVSAQNRERLYWIGELQENGKYMTVDIPQPEDKKIFLKDILQDQVDEKYYLSQKLIEWFLSKQSEFKDRFKISSWDDKWACLTAKNQGSAITQTYILWAAQRWRKKNWVISQELEINPSWKSNCITTVSKDSLVLFNTHPSWKGQNGNVYDTSKKSPTLTTNKGEWVKILQDVWRIRKLTPIECERLQTVPDNYTDCVSNSQRYKMLWNGWTIDVIAHILSHLDFSWCLKKNNT